MRPENNNSFPSNEQELLLKAALLKTEDALMYWNKWNERVDFEGHFDHGSFRLLPLVYKNLLAYLPDVKYSGKLKNVYLQSWYKNQKLFYECGRQLKRFSAEGINVIVLKGIPLSFLAYRDKGARPMSDIDLLINPNQAEKAFSLLKDDGYLPEKEEYIAYNLKYGKSISFRNNEKIEIDIHWYPFFEARVQSPFYVDYNFRFSFYINEYQLFTLCPADLLLHVIVHGLNYNPEPPVRWIPDAVKILENLGDQIDWDYFFQQMVRFNATYKMKSAFLYLTENFPINIPSQILRRLNQHKSTLRERLLFQNSRLIEEEVGKGIFRKLFRLYLIYLQQSGRETFLKHIIGFIRFLRYRTAYQNPFKILLFHIFVRDKKHR